ncbi:type VII secretion system-associated protein [Amycolatopsis solani]|uniref:type VII secretion system-associated protein n=1 Tax=Amycolatopsis solani TaxID=3028615 RepID=UPI0025B1EC23|nr:type VII secretion system-associated protein [Amycolatopsis sp. MEP2-6]
MTAEKWVLLIDPAWRPEPSAPDRTHVVGGWLTSADGSIGAFEPNPAYEPSGPDSPADPLDAVLRLLAAGDAEFAQVASVFRRARPALALDAAGAPLTAPSPDGVPCLLAATAPTHRGRVRTAGWRAVDAAELAELLAERPGTDLLLNPGAPGCTRLPAQTVRDLTRT